MSLVNSLIKNNKKLSESEKHNTKVLEVLKLTDSKLEVVPAPKVEKPVISLVIPDSSIRDEYTDDYNIINAHNRIIEWFEYEKTFLIKEKKDKVIELQNATCLTVLERKNNNRIIKILNDEIIDIEKDIKIINYKTEIHPVIVEYSREFNKSLTISLENEDSSEITLKKERRVSLIEKFNSIASRHFDIILTRNILYTSNCPECSKDYREVGTIENGMYICECGWNSNISSSIKECMSSSRLAGPTKNYQNEDNFRKKLLSFFDALSIKYSPVLLDELDVFFSKICDGKYHRNVIKFVALDAKGIKIGTSTKIMRQALKSTGNQKYYNNIYKICQDYWGWILPNLSHIEDSIMNKRRLVMAEFDLIKGDKKSAMNGDFLLYKLLRTEGIPCEQEDVKMISTSNIYILYVRTYECIRLKLGWEDD